MLIASSRVLLFSVNNDQVEDSENANEVDVDDAGDENPPYDDQFEGGDDISEGGGVGDCV